MASAQTDGFTYQNYESATQFLDAAGERLLEQECANNLAYGIAATVADGWAYGDVPPFFATVSRDGVFELAAVMTPPHRMILAGLGPRAEEAARMLARELRAEPDVPVAGVMGPVALPRAFAAAWCDGGRVAATDGKRLRTHELRAVHAVPSAPGRLRPAAEQDRDVLVGWVRAFNVAIGEQDGEEYAREVVARRTGGGDLFVWDDNGPVSMAVKTRPTPNGIAVGMVYTPPEFRNRGYATSCVAGVCRLVLAGGKRFVMLFTDLANPVSNHIYREIGFEPVMDFVELDFADSRSEERGGTAKSEVR